MSFDSALSTLGNFYHTLYRVDATKMGLICSVALMGDPSGEIGKGTTSSKVAFTRLQQMTSGEDNYKVAETQCTDDDGPFSVYIADTKDLDKIYTGDVKLVSLV